MAIDTQRLITDTLLLVGYAAFGDAPDAESALLASRTLNDMLQEWSANSWINPVLKSVSLDVTAKAEDEIGAVNYITVGSDDPAFDIPEEIMDLVEVKVQLGQIVYNLNNMPYAEYLGMSIKNVPAIPQYYSYDYQFGTGKIYFHMAAMTGYKVIVSYKPRLGTLANNQGTIALDPIYRQALLYNLASRLSPYLAPTGGLSQDIIYHAQHSLNVIKQRQQRLLTPKARPSYFTGGNAGGYWLSPLNTVNN